MKQSNLAQLVLLLLLPISAFSQKEPVYGSNKSAGNFVQLNGVNHYYEVYGSGPPLLLIHGNGRGIEGMAPQINYFKDKYKVYTIDCRGRGKTALGNDTISYIQQAKDMAAFIQAMRMDSVYIIGKSDGGIVAILLSIYFPLNIKRIVAFGSNMQPDTTALFKEALAVMKATRENAERKIAVKDTTKNWEALRQLNHMMEVQPYISAAELNKSQVPVLVMSCDRDLIKEEHTFFIYRNMPLASLCILQGETHFVLAQNPELFNSTVAKYFVTPLKGKAYKYRAKT